MTYIAELRRQRRAAKGKAERAAAMAQDLKWKASREWAMFYRLGEEIKALGGRIRE